MTVIMVKGKVCVDILCVFMFWVPCCDVRYDLISVYKRCSIRLYNPQLFAEVVFTSYLLYLCLIVYIGLRHVLYWVFILFVFILCNLYMLPVSLDCPFLIAPSVLSNVYLTRGLSEPDSFTSLFNILHLTSCSF